MRTMLLLLFVWMCVSATAQKAVFTSGQDGYRSFRIPAIVRAGNGDLLAFCEGRINGINDFGNIKIVMKRSRDNGATWSALQIVASNDTLQAGNSAPVLDVTDPAYPHGRLFLFYCTGDKAEGQVRKGIGTREVWYKTSTDNGATWSEPVNITSQVKLQGWRTYANTPGHAMQFENGPYRGRIYIAANHSAGDPQPHFMDFKAHGYYTDDHGKTFHLSEDVPFPGGNECMAAPLAAGRLMLSIRNQQGHPRARVIAISNDGGIHWDTTYIDMRLPDPVCQGSILTLSGGRHGRRVVAVCNPADTAERDNLTLHLSFDEGGRWARTIVVDPVRQKDHAAYSDLVDLGDHRIGVLYERDDYKTISFADVKW
ncbi:MAG TPA: sialidase family protein [Puia sp.]|nr:sialidase family protein [Puia sp.]